MSVIQISKIQVRTGEFADLPQLAVGELGFCTDTRQVFIGNDPNLFPPANSFTTTQTELITSGSQLPAAGVDQQVQYNKAGSTFGSSGLTFDYSTNSLTVGNGITANGSLTIGGNASITGNLTVTGNLITVNQSNLSVADPIIDLNVSNSNVLTTPYATGVRMFYYAPGNTGNIGSTFMGWTGVSLTANVASNTIAFGYAPGFNGSGYLNAVTLANTAASALTLTGNSANTLNIVNGGANINNLNVLSNASFANGTYNISYNAGTNVSTVTFANTSVVNIGGIVFQNGNASLPANGTFSGTFSGNVNLPANATIAAPGGMANTGQLLFNSGGDIGGSNAVTYSGGVFTLASADIAVNGGDVTTNAASATLFNTSATTLAIGGAATSITLGASTGNFTVNNPNIVGASTVNLFSTSSTVTIANSASSISIGASNSAQTTTINNQLVVSGNANVSRDLYVNRSSYFGTSAGTTASILTTGVANFQSTTIGSASQLSVSSTGDLATSGKLSTTNSAVDSIKTSGGINVASSANFAGIVSLNNTYFQQSGSGLTNTIAGSLNAGVDVDAGNSMSSPSVFGTTKVQTPLLTTGGSGTGGTVTGQWSLSSGSRLQATYADLAEYYEADQSYEPGTVLVFGGDKEVTQSTTEYDTRVAGVVSTEPAYTMNKQEDGTEGHFAIVALVGRVPCKVLGPVAKGAVLVTSGLEGTAQGITNSQFQPGVVIGKALEEIRESTVKTIEVVVGRF